MGRHGHLQAAGQRPYRNAPRRHCADTRRACRCGAGCPPTSRSPAIKRKLLGCLGLLTLLTLGLVIVVQMRAEPADLPAPDPAQLIHLPDGSARTLAGILDLVRASEPLPVLAEASTGASAGARLFDLADAAVDAGRLDEAAALYLSIPEDDPLYAHARRRLAWEVLSKGRGEPRRAVDLVHSSLAAAPFDNDVWEDVVRVYLGTLGADTSGWD